MNKIIIILMSFLLLVGCEEKTNTFYSYGLDNSCYKEKEISKCSTYKPYDILNVAVNKQNNTVTFQLVGIGLNDSNTIFKTLNDCNVLDVNNFSCTDLVSIDGKLTNINALGHRIVNSNWLLYQVLSITEIGIKKNTIAFINNNDWVTSLVTIFGILFLIGLLAG